eukprot:5540211-Amphidinium_carterae.1
MRSHDDMGKMGQMAKDELERMRGQKKQKPETEIVGEGGTIIKKATPSTPTGINPVPLPPPPKAKSSDIVLPNISDGMPLPPPPTSQPK